MKVWTVLVQHANRDAWVDSIYESHAHARRRAAHIENSGGWLDATVHPFIVIPETTPPLPGRPVTNRKDTTHDRP